MSRIKWDKQANKYKIIFADGTISWASAAIVESTLPDRNWDVVKNNSEQWFYI